MSPRVRTAFAEEQTPERSQEGVTEPGLGLFGSGRRMFSEGSGEKSCERAVCYLQSEIDVLVALQVFKSKKNKMCLVYKK